MRMLPKKIAFFGKGKAADQRGGTLFGLFFVYSLAALPRPISIRLAAVLLQRRGLGLMFQQSKRLRAGTQNRAVSSSTDTGWKGNRILLFSPYGLPARVAFQAVVAKSIILRGAECAVYFCGGGMPYCEMGSVDSAIPQPCFDCAAVPLRLYKEFGVPYYQLHQLVNSRDVEEAESAVRKQRDSELEDLRYDGYRLWDLLKVSVHWWFRSETIPPSPASTLVKRNALATAILLSKGVERLLDQFRPTTVVIDNGLFVSQRMLVESCRKRGIRWFTYEPLIDGLFLADRSFVVHIDFPEEWSKWSGRPLTGLEAAQFVSFMDVRFGLSEGEPNPKRANASKEMEAFLRPWTGRKVLALFTSVQWDSAALFRDIAFPSMLDWIVATIEFVRGREDVVLVIRIHPEEVSLDIFGTYESVESSIRARIGKLPENVLIISFDSKLNSYELMRRCDVGLVYSSTTGLELATIGKPVMVAGLVHYRGKGFTLDMTKKEEYFRMLSHLDQIKPLTPAQTETARRYAFFYFYRLPIPYTLSTDPRQDGAARLNFTSYESLLPGRDKGLDRMLDAILGSTGITG